MMTGIYQGIIYEKHEEKYQYYMNEIKLNSHNIIYEKSIFKIAFILLNQEKNYPHRLYGDMTHNLTVRMKKIKLHHKIMMQVGNKFEAKHNFLYQIVTLYNKILKKITLLKSSKLF